MTLKIAFIGAGSVGFTRRLVRDVLSVPELTETHFALHDIDGGNLDRITQLIRKDVKANKLGATFAKHPNRRKALEGADYVINCTRIGGMEAFKHDIEVPLKYGIDQCVGDTLCAGGIMYGQRNIPQILAFCKDIREVAAPDVLFLNYANPMAMNTWAALQYGKVNTVGLCHGVQGAHRQIAAVLGAENTSDVHIVAAGINHQTWFIKVLYQGRFITAKELLAGFEKHPTYSKTEKVRIDVLRRFGYYSTESNGHLSEYVPWYRKRPKEIRKWIDLSRSWIDGETGGYLRTCTESRNWFNTDFPRWLNAEDKPINAADRSSEHGSYIIESIETGRVYRGHFNRRNDSTISNLAPDAIVETPGFVDRFGINTPKVGDLPLACAATCEASINVQRMSVEAAVHGDLTLLKQAMLHDPLTAAVCNPEEIWQMTDEMLVTQSKWLPQYAGAVGDAKKRLAACKRLGTKTWKGAARLPVRDVEELRAKADAANAVSADKGNLTGRGAKTARKSA